MEFASEPALPLSSNDNNCLTASLADLVKGLFTPSDMGILLSIETPIPEYGSALMVLSLRSMLLDRELEDAFPPVLLGHRC